MSGPTDSTAVAVPPTVSSVSVFPAVKTYGVYKDPSYIATLTHADQSKSDCVADVVCCQNLLISSTIALVDEYYDLQNFYYTGLGLEDQSLYSLPPDPASWFQLILMSYLGFSLGTDLFAIYHHYLQRPEGQHSITIQMGASDMIIGAQYFAVWSASYNVQAQNDRQTIFRLIPNSQIAMDPKCLPEPCRCKLGSSGLIDSFTVTLTGELQEVKLSSVSGIFLEIATQVIGSTVGKGPVAKNPGQTALATELGILSMTMDQLQVNPVCADCCDKNCMLDFLLISVGDNKNCCSSVCCPDTCTTSGVSISAIPIPVLALPPDCCPPCSGPTSGPCKGHWDNYVKNIDPATGEHCSAHQPTGHGVLPSHDGSDGHLDGTHLHEIPGLEDQGLGLGVLAPPAKGSTGTSWTGGGIGIPYDLSSPQKDGKHAHYVTKKNGDPISKHEYGAQFVEDILNSTLSQCCTFYFASTEGIFYQTGQTYWSKDSAEGSSDFSTSYAMVPRGESGTKYMAPVFDAWLLASLQGTAILPKSLTHEQLTQQMSGLVRDKETGSMRLPHAATGPGSQLVVMASNHGKHSYSNTRDGLLLTQGAQPTLRDFM